MKSGDLFTLFGPQIGVDSLGQPEFKNEIYDPATSRPDPKNPAAVLHDATLPATLFQPIKSIQQPAGSFDKVFSCAKIWVLRLAAGVCFPQSSNFDKLQSLRSTVSIAVDHRFRNNDTLFGRYNRSNIDLTTPESLPGYLHTLGNFAQTVSAGYPRLFLNNEHPEPALRLYQHQCNPDR